MRESTSMQQPNKGRLIWQNVRITDVSFVSAPTAAAEARQVGLLHGGEPLQAADDSCAVQQPPGMQFNNHLEYWVQIWDKLWDRFWDYFSTKSLD